MRKCRLQARRGSCRPWSGARHASRGMRGRGDPEKPKSDGAREQAASSVRARYSVAASIVRGMCARAKRPSRGGTGGIQRSVCPAPASPSHVRSHRLTAARRRRRPIGCRVEWLMAKRDVAHACCPTGPHRDGLITRARCARRSASDRRLDTPCVWHGVSVRRSDGFRSGAAA